ncbi:Fatty acid hydroxylase [Ostreococcus tauri]|uniref:Fatty acid hydroxylase n=1 Tax=Ostreococcus tauri TaxID=70448 RepID=A0A096PAA7_OSTTA|nr:Fatty acid hydroxylase [Ostreococcus tauri]CEG00882.1 Fatty acid hydroxylase [Ostreococcus tauri]|eukprot:XP_022840646.1 Fatty acid hydroxylase [Ostreococcus tauri]
MFSRLAWACGGIQYFGYIALSTLIELRYFVKEDSGDAGDGNDARSTSERSTTTSSSDVDEEVREWKIQPGRAATGTVRTTKSDPWGFPLYQMITGRHPKGGKHDGGKGARVIHPRHRLYASVNLLMSACFAFAVGESVARGWTRMYGGSNVDATFIGSIYDILRGFAVATVWQSVLEYYWHRAMHARWFYERAHKIHHFYVSPCCWCDLCIHPMEAFGYYCILYAPGFFFPLHRASFILYMAVMGVCGVMDHSGVDVSFADGAYDTTFHDAHHRLFFVNYAFPFDIIDRLCGTYVHGRTDPRPSPSR